MRREYGSLEKHVFGSVLFDWDMKGAIYTARTTNQERIKGTEKASLIHTLFHR